MAKIFLSTVSAATIERDSETINDRGIECIPRKNLDIY